VLELVVVEPEQHAVVLAAPVRQSFVELGFEEVAVVRVRRCSFGSR